MNIDINAIQAAWPDINCTYVESTPSTQDAVKPNSLLVADHQTAGVGRRGNQWLTPKGKSICLSHRFILPMALEHMAGYQMMVAMAITNSIKHFDAAASVQLKWPNDVYHQGKKFAGILINLMPQQQTTEVIVGIGINWQLTQKHLHQVDQPVCNVPLDPLPGRTEYICILMTHLYALNQDFIANGLVNCLQQWQQHDYLKGQNIHLTGVNLNQTGQYLGISNRGELMMQTDLGIKHFSSGEVSVKAL